MNPAVPCPPFCNTSCSYLAFVRSPQLLEESGDLEAALALLETESKWFVNKTEWAIKRAELLTKLGHFEQGTRPLCLHSQPL